MKPEMNSDRTEVSAMAAKVLMVKASAQAAEGEIIEGQVHGKEAEAEAEARRIMGEEGKARRAAGKQSRAGEKRYAEHGEHAAGDDALGVVEERMTIGAGIQNACESVGCHVVPLSAFPSSIRGQDKGKWQAAEDTS